MGCYFGITEMYLIKGFNYLNFIAAYNTRRSKGQTDARAQHPKFMTLHRSDNRSLFH